MTTLMKASSQWASRPADERYSSLEALHAACTEYSNRGRTSVVPYRSLEVTGNGVPMLRGKTGVQAQFTHWAFGQLCARVGAPASYLRELPAPLAAANLNHGLQTLADDGEPNASLLIDKPSPDSLDNLTVRAFTSERYTRIWNCDITARLLRLAMEHPEWQPAPAASDGSRGLYASDHDLFAFLVDNDRRIFEKDPNGGLARGFFCWNSEVGAASFGVLTFLYEYVCGNHRVWGAQGIRELRIRHIGDADTRAFRQLAAELRNYADSSPTDEEAKIASARTFSLGKDKDAVLDRVFGLRLPGLSRGKAEDAYALAERHVDWYGDPRSAWGFTGGLTQLARDLPYADDRVALDRAAGKVMALAF